MNKEEYTLILEEELENLREKLNKYVVKDIKDINKERYKKLLDISKKLDDVIVNYMKSVNG